MLSLAVVASSCVLIYPLASSFNLASFCVLFHPLKSSLPSISSSFLLVIAETPRSEAVSNRNCAQRYSTEPSMMPKGGTQKPAMPKKTAKINDHTDIVFCILCRVMLFLLSIFCFSCSWFIVCKVGEEDRGR